MSKQKKKDKKSKAKQKNAGADAGGLQAELERLRQENEQLRARLESIAELAHTPVQASLEARDVEDEEYDELSRDVDDEIADDEGAQQSGTGGGAGRS